MNNETLKKTFLDSLEPLDNECQVSLSDFTTDQLNAFASIASNLCEEIESYIHNTPRLRELIESDYTSCSIGSITFGEDGITFHMLENGCSCCPHDEWDRTIPTSWLTGAGWKAEAERIETAKKAKESKERRERELKAKEAKLREEEKDLSEFKRLSVKFGSKV